MTLATVSERVEKSRTSPDCCGIVDAGDGVGDDCVVSGEAADGTGEGYARYEQSAEGERAHIAVA
jgi:hypothetical protein